MSKKQDRRRRARRRQHQEVRTDHCRARRQEIRDALHTVRTAIEGLATAAADDALAPVDVADRCAACMDDELVAALLTTPELGAEQGQALARALAPVRAQALGYELAARSAADPRLAWFTAGLLEGVGALDDAVGVAAAGLDALDRAETPRGERDADRRAAADAACLLAELYLGAGRIGDALALLDRRCAGAPDHLDLQAMRAHAFARATTMRRPGDHPPGPGTTASFAHFTDGSLLTQLRQGMERFIAADPDLAAWHADAVSSWTEVVRERGGLGPFDQLRVEAPGMAAEWAWLSDPDPTERPDLPDSPDLADSADLADSPDLADSASLLGRFADDPATPPPLAAAARDWLRYVHYGLWLWDGPGPLTDRTADPTAEPTSEPAADPISQSAPGAWLTDIVTRRTVFAALPPDHHGLARWSILMGPLGPVDGVWHSGASLVVLDPAAGDRVAEAVLEMTDDVVRALATERGLRLPPPRPTHRGAPPPHGVLSDLLDPMDDAEADITAKVLGSALGDLLGLVEAINRTGPTLTNTDGDPLELMRARFVAADPAGVRRKLLAGTDFEGDDDDRMGPMEIAPPLRWLGRIMTVEEAANAAAQFRVEAAKAGLGPVPEPEGPRRWLRGEIHFEVGTIRVEVNSRRRLDAITAALQLAGAVGEPTVDRIVDPAMDLPIAGGRVRGGRAGDPEVEATWRQHWLDTPLPALDGSTPRRAATSDQHRPLLEALLRQFEHDADLTALDGHRPLDVAWLRTQLHMEDGVRTVDPPPR